MDRCILASRVPSFLLSAAVLALGACKSEQPKSTATAAPAPAAKAAPPAPAEIVNDYTASADVVAVAPETRVITLRREDGTTYDVVAGAEVRNFDQIAAGDKLRVRYRESLNAALCPPGTAVKAVEGAYGAARAPRGAKPAAGAGWTASTRVRVESIDRERGIVVFSKPSGELGAHKVKTPQGRDFIKGLNVGDVVQLDYTQAVAVAVEKE